MLLSIVILLIVGLVAYFHYVQGFFSATISAVISVLAAAIALSYYEPIVTKLLGGKFADTAPAMVLCLLFAGTYIIVRTISDAFVPGNLRLPVLAEKVGAGVMGIVAGLFTGGIVAIAAQTLPFGASVGMFSRFETNAARDVQIPTSGQSQDTFVYEALKDEDIDKNRSEDRHSLWVPADEIVLATVQRLSNEGSLAGGQTLNTIHPDLMEEVYLSNLGIQIGAKRSAINIGKQVDVKLDGLFTAPSVTETDGEIDAIRKRPLPAMLAPRPTDMILVVRAIFGRQATDADNKFRFSPGACRLVAGGKNYYPVGTLERGKHMFATALDDYLICDADKGADLVYVLPRADVLTDPKPTATKLTIKEGVFVEIKRLAQFDLTDKKVTTPITPSPQVQVIRKEQLVRFIEKGGLNGKPAAPANPEGGAAAAPVAEGTAPVGPLAFDAAQADGFLPHGVNTGVPEKTINNFTTVSATGSLANGQFTKLEVNGTESIQRMSAGSYTVAELGAPAGQKVVKAHFTIAGTDPAAYESQIASYQLVDDKGAKYAPHGVIADVKTSEGGDRMVARYNAAANVSDLPHVDGRATDVWIVFCVPDGTQLKQLIYKDQNAAAIDVTAQ